MSKEIVCAWCHRNAYFGDLISYGNEPYFHEACRGAHHLIIGGQEQTTTLPEPLPAAPATTKEASNG